MNQQKKKKLCVVDANRKLLNKNNLAMDIIIVQKVIAIIIESVLIKIKLKML